MELQLELFSNYPRLAPPVIVERPDLLDKAWELFDYPENDGENTAESPEHADEIINIKNAISAMLSEIPKSFAAVDTNFYLIMRERNAKGLPIMRQRKLAPDITVALNVADVERNSFNLRLEQ